MFTDGASPGSLEMERAVETASIRVGRREVPYFDQDWVFQRVSPAAAIEAVRAGFIRYDSGDWRMPPKVYLDSPPHGDFRAMPAGGSGLAILKWVSSFPLNDQSVPTVSAIVCVSDATTGELTAIVEGSAVTALRTGASAAIATLGLAPADAASVGIIGCGLNGSWAARCLKQAGYEEGVCVDLRIEASESVASEVGWRVGSIGDALSCDIVTTITPGSAPVIQAKNLRPGMHLNALGADGPGKAEFSLDALARCSLFCDEWHQASHGGELAGSVAAGLVNKEQVVELSAVLAGRHPGRTAAEEITCFDSTGLAVQDLAIVDALMSQGAN